MTFLSPEAIRWMNKRKPSASYGGLELNRIRSQRVYIIIINCSLNSGAAHILPSRALQLRSIFKGVFFKKKKIRKKYRDNCLSKLIFTQLVSGESNLMALYMFLYRLRCRWVGQHRLERASRCCGLCGSERHVQRSHLQGPQETHRLLQQHGHRWKRRGRLQRVSCRHDRGRGFRYRRWGDWKCKKKKQNVVHKQMIILKILLYV